MTRAYARVTGRVVPSTIPPCIYDREARMQFGLDEDQIEDLLNERLPGKLDAVTIKAIAITVATNNQRFAADVQRRIDSVLEELLH
jgi:hypothetical protein